MCEDLTGKLVPPAPPVPGSGNAAGKRLCGICIWRTDPKNAWVCRTFDGRGVKYPCPAPDGKCAGFFEKPSVVRPDQPKKKGLPVPEGVKFIYIGAPRGETKKGVPQHQGVVTIAWISPSPGTLHLGFSFCSPEDRWCKATGRDMALARLLRPLVIPFLYDTKRTVHEVVRAVLTHDFMRIAVLSPGATMWGRVPGWTRGLAKRMKEKERMLGGRIRRLKVPSLPDFLGGIYIAPPTRDLPFNIMAKMLIDIAQLGEPHE